MTQELHIKNTDKILEIGTGSCYQCSILSLLCRRVYTVERIKSLLVKAELIFKKLKLTNIVTKHDDGNLGWKEQIPFDKIIFTAVTEEIPNSFFDHLKEGGILISPVKKDSKQILNKYTKINGSIEVESLSEVIFVPNLTGIKD